VSSPSSIWQLTWSLSVAKDGPLAEEIALKPSKAKREALGQLNFWQIIFPFLK
jgi:hypothetical protein